MIRTDRDYEQAIRDLQNDQEIMKQQEETLRKDGLSEEDVNFAMQPAISFHEQLKEEVEWYERVKRGDFSPIEDVQELGQLLIGLRIYCGLSQRELADLLRVSEAMVSRDERNEYHGITTDRAQRIIEAMKATVEIRVKPPERQLVCA